jgi:Na+/citrate or Na+/malate symporter
VRRFDSALAGSRVARRSNRMHLMPFAALTNRGGGALGLFVTSLLVPLLAAT